MINRESIKSTLDGLERKILMLINERKTLKKELAYMRLENDRLTKDIQHKKEVIADLQQHIKVEKIANRIGSDNADKIALKKQIDSYIAEIDRCIAYLNA